MPQRLPIIPALSVFSLGALFAFVLITCRAPSGTTGAASANAAPATQAATSSQPSSHPAAQARMRTEDERNTIEVFKKAAPGAVFVTQHQYVVDWLGGRATEVPAGSGSGFIWDTDGHVVTNFHVVQGAKKLTVTIQGHQTFDALVRGVEPRKDIAVLKIDAPKELLHPIAHASRIGTVEVGQKVIAIGNPFGLDQTLTTGVVSALGREVEGVAGVKIREMVQTDAAINPGNSGGPLLDSSGNLLGMNTMIYSRSGASAGIGFAVPASTIARVVPQLVSKGKVEQVGIGVEIDPQQRLEQRFRIRGVVILAVTPGTPAAQAGLAGLRRGPRGLELGDVVVGIGSTQINTYDDLYNTLDQHRAGDTVALKVARGKSVIEVPIKLVLLD